VDLPALLSDLLPPLLVQAARLGVDLYLNRRAQSSKRDPSDEEPKGKHEKRS
jgi:hypothetical protein